MKKTISVLLLALISVHPYYRIDGLYLEIIAREGGIGWVRDHKYFYKSSDVNIKVDNRTFNQEEFEPKTKTLYLSGLWLDNR